MRGRALGVVVFFIVTSILLTIGLSFAVLLHVESAQSSHSATLYQIARVTEATNRLADELHKDEIQAAQGAKTVSQILREAGLAVQVLEAQEQAICASLPGCKH